MRKVKMTEDDVVIEEEVTEDEKTKVEVMDQIANVYINGPICNETVHPVIEFMINSSLKETDLKGINLFIDSTGGDLDAAMKMIEAMDLCEIPIRTLGWGKIASAALMIFFNGDERLLSRNCSILSHNASFNATSYSIRINDPSQQKEFKLINERILNHYIQCTQKEASYIKRHLLKDYDVCLSAEEAIRHNLADGIIPKGTAWLKTFDFQK